MAYGLIAVYGDDNPGSALLSQVTSLRSMTGFVARFVVDSVRKTLDPLGNKAKVEVARQLEQVFPSAVTALGQTVQQYGHEASKDPDSAIDSIARGLETMVNGDWTLCDMYCQVSAKLVSEDSQIQLKTLYADAIVKVLQ